MNPSPLLGSNTGEQFTSVQELLDAVWFALPPDKVTPFSYGKDWQLKDEKSKKPIKDLGRNSTYVKSRNKQKDDRTLHDVGIEPGARLSIVRPSSRSS